MEGKEFLHRAVVGFFNIIGKITGGQLILAPVVRDAFAADPFAGTGVVRTIAAFLVDLELAFHRQHYLRWL
jgi:hypothetical protein